MPPAFHVTAVPAVQVNVNQSTASHSLGVAALVLGVVSLVAWCVPGIGIIIGGLGALLGFLGLALAIMRKGRGIGYAIAGTALSCIGLMMGIALTLAVSKTVAELDQSGRRRQATPSNSLETNSPRSDEPTWNSAQQPLALGSVQVRIVDVRIGRVPMQTMFGDNTESENELLTIWLEIQNVTERKKVDYLKWMRDFSFGSESIELTDDSDNRYRTANFGSGRLPEAAETGAIYPGKSLTDVVIFERPVDGVRYLHLRLPGRNVGEDGEFRFEIPASMVRRRILDMRKLRQ